MTWLDGYGATQILKSMTSGPINARTITTAMQHTKNLNMLGAVPNWSYSYDSLGRVHERLQRVRGDPDERQRRDPEQREQARLYVADGRDQLLQGPRVLARTVS